MKRFDDTADRLAGLRETMDAGTSVPDEEVAFLRQCLAHPRKNLQRQAAESLAELVREQPQRGVALFDAFESPDARVRWGAAYTLSLLGEFPTAATETAIELLGTEDRDLRWAAADLLKRAAANGESAVMNRLCEVAGKASSLQRRMALYALRDLAIGEPAALAAAYDALEESSVELRLAGLAALARLAEEPSGAANRIIVLLDDPEPRMQRAAAATLGLLGLRSQTVLRALGGALASRDESVRRAAKRSLERLREP